MSLTTPSQSNSYLFDLSTPLDPPTLNAVFTSIHTRIKAQEALVVDYQAAIDNLNNLGLQVIADNLAPQIQAVRDQINALQVAADLLADEIAAQQAGEKPAASVSLTAIAGLTATNAQAAIAELLADITAEAQARQAAITAEAQARQAAITAEAQARQAAFSSVGYSIAKAMIFS